MGVSKYFIERHPICYEELANLLTLATENTHTVLAAIFQVNLV